MTYNRFLYNTALYNAGRDEVGAVAKSIIQAHTGPHIQAVVGEIPSGKADQAGIAFISDFVITEGTVKKPPTSFKFPDLSAIVRAVQAGRDDLPAFIRGFGFKDLPACIFLVNEIPDLPASVFGFAQKDLAAFLFGKLAEKDLPAIIFVTVKNLAGFMLGIEAPELGGAIFVQPPGNLGARIHAPLDLIATMQAVQRKDLVGNIFAFQAKTMPAFMFGQPAPILTALIKGFASDFSDLPSLSSARDEANMGATTVPTIPGPSDFLGLISAEGTFDEVIGFLRPVAPGIPDDLKATIGKEFGVTFDLQAIIDFFGAKNIKGSIEALAFGANDLFLTADLQPVHPDNLAATISSNSNLKNLLATIESLRDTEDLGAFLRVSETFVTAILTVTTLASRSLRATVGLPDCAGGSGNLSLPGSLVVQHAKSLNALIDSFIENNLGAVINSGTIVHALDVIDVFYSRSRVRNPIFLTTDTIDILYTRFRGDNLGALIQAVARNTDLGASLVAAFPFPAVAPTVSRLLSADLRAGEELNIQEVRFQLEGALLEYFYVNGSDLAFIKDSSQVWKINVSAFRAIAENLFGDFAAGKICRLGSLTSFTTLDEAVRSCIDVVIGLQGQSNMAASIQITGQIGEMAAALEVASVFGNMPATVSRVFPVDFGASIEAIDAGVLKASVKGTGFAPGSTTGNLGAFIAQESEDDLAMLLTTSGGPPFQPNVVNAILLSAVLPQPTLVLDMGATVSGSL